MKREPAILALLLYAGFSILAGVSGLSVFTFFYAAVSTSLLASAAFMYRRRIIAVFPPLAAAVTFIITRSVLGTAASLLLTVIPASALAISLFLGFDNKARAVTAVCASAAFSLLILFGLYLLSGGAILSVEDIVGRAEGWFSSLSVPGREGPVQVFPAEAASGLARYIVVCMPALSIIALSAASYAAVSLTVLFVDIFSFGDKIEPGVREYTPNVISAVLYVAAYIVSASLLSDPSADIIGYTAENLLLLILPAMMIAGEKSLLRLAKKHDRRVLFTVLTVLLLLVSPSIYLMAVSFFGAGYLIFAELRAAFRKFIDKHRRDDDDDFDDFDDDFGGFGFFRRRGDDDYDDYDDDYEDDDRYGRRDGGNYESGDPDDNSRDSRDGGKGEK